jgi:uncharacterized coiled-coil DUF342 family protein
MFESPFNKQNQSSSLFSSPLSPQNSEEKIAQLYQEMEYLQKQRGNVNHKTVFTEIAEEMKGVSEDEKRFIESSQEYMEAAQKYQTDFSMFLIEHLGNDFAKSQYGKSPEQVLAAIRKKKEEYKNHFAADITEIRDKNNVLAQRNEELARTNQNLQKQLAEIQKQLGGLK